MERLNDHRHTSPPPGSLKDELRRERNGAKPEEPERIQNPGKGKRTPALWGQWLTGGLKGLQRQLLDALNWRQRRSLDANRGNPMYQGTLPAHVIAKRRAKAKAGRRQRVHQSMAKRGKR